MSRAQLQQDIANALALAGQDWVQGSAALNAAFANMLTSLDNMGNQVLAMQAQATATATAMAQTAKISQVGFCCNCSHSSAFHPSILGSSRLRWASSKLST